MNSDRRPERGSGARSWWRVTRERVLGNRQYTAAVATSYGQVAVGVVIQVVMVPLYLRHLGTYRFGVLMMMLAFVNFAALGVGWLSGGSLRLMSEAFARKDERSFADVYAVSKWIFIGYALVVALVVGGVLLVAVEVLIDVPAEFVRSVRGGIIGAGVYLICLYAFGIDRVALISRGRQALADILAMASQGVYLLGAVPILLLGGDLVHLMSAFALGALLALVLARVTWRRDDLPLSATVRPTSEHRRLGRRLVGRMGAGYLAYGMLALALQADTLIVGWFAGPTVVAEFVLVWRIAELSTNALWRLPDALQPFIIHMEARGEAGRLTRSYRTMLLTTTSLGVAVALVYGLAGPEIVGAWVGSEHAPGGRGSYMLAGLAVVWLVAARVPVVFAYATARLERVTLIMAVELIFKVALIAILFSDVGFVAPILAINIAHAGGLAIAYQLAGRRSLRAAVGAPAGVS